MSNNIYGVDLGTCNVKIVSKADGTIITEKNAIAIRNKREFYAFGNEVTQYGNAPCAIIQICI